MIERLISEDLLAEINYDNVPNASNIADNIKPFMEEFDPGMVHSLPHTWGTYGIMYNTTMVNSEIDSWEDLWDTQYSGQIVMPEFHERRLYDSCQTPWVFHEHHR